MNLIAASMSGTISRSRSTSRTDDHQLAVEAMHAAGELFMRGSRFLTVFSRGRRRELEHLADLIDQQAIGFADADRRPTAHRRLAVVRLRAGRDGRACPPAVTMRPAKIEHTGDIAATDSGPGSGAVPALKNVPAPAMDSAVRTAARHCGDEVGNRRFLVFGLAGHIEVTSHRQICYCAPLRYRRSVPSGPRIGRDRSNLAT